MISAPCQVQNGIRLLTLIWLNCVSQSRDRIDLEHQFESEKSFLILLTHVSATSSWSSPIAGARRNRLIPCSKVLSAIATVVQVLTLAICSIINSKLHLNWFFLAHRKNHVLDSYMMHSKHGNKMFLSTLFSSVLHINAFMAKFRLTPTTKTTR